MASLTNTKIKDTYDGLLKTTDNDALGGTYKLITDGLGNSSNVYLGTGGSVGIGTSTLNTISGSNPVLTLGGTGITGGLILQNSGTDTARIYETGGLFIHQGMSGIGHSFYVNASTEAMRIDSSGNVGIGTSSPSGGKLHIYATNTPIKFESSGLTLYNTYTNSNGNFGFVGSGNGVASGGNANDFGIQAVNNFVFATGGSTERLRIDSSGNVGIGAVPSEILTIQRSSGNNLVNFNTNDGVAKLYLGTTNISGGGIVGATIGDGIVRATQNLLFSAGGATERMRIDSSGNVGIGTTSPDTILHTYQSSANYAAHFESANANSYGVWVEEAASANNGYPLLTVTSNGGTDTYLRVDSGTGNVGIGTSSPSAYLEIETSGSSGSDDIAIFSRSTGEVLKISREAGEAVLNASSNLTLSADYDNNNTSTGSNVIFKTDATERMRITSGGSLLIGTTSSGGAGGLTIIPNNSNGAASIFYNRNSTTATSFVQDFRNGGSTVGFISYNNTAVTYSTTSDYRLKENVVDLTGALDRVDQLEPKRFNFIADEDTTVDGFLAHQVQDIVPEAVTGEKDAVDDEGNPQYQGIDQSKIVPLLVGAIKELKAEIETLKSQINS